MEERTYLCIDLKSFYASVECVERGLDPMTTNLVVADPERSDKTICLAVSPSLKALGVKNRSRVFEIPSHINYITAPPRMQKYIDYSANIYGIYLRFIAPEDIFVYSIDEVFIDATSYLHRYNMQAKEFALFLMEKVKSEIGVRATCGIGTNLYLAKIALDITAKHSPSFIGYLDEKLFIETLWDHRPLTDFWRIGKGTARRLERYGIFTMRQIAHAPEDLLYKEFGCDAELMIDHANGREIVTILDIQAYKPINNSVSSGQVLMRDYSFSEALVVVKEMADTLSLELERRKMIASTFSLSIGFAKSSGGGYFSSSATIDNASNLNTIIRSILVKLYSSIPNKSLLIRRFMLNATNLVKDDDKAIQLDLFVDKEEEDKKRKIAQAVLEIKDEYGKNAILKGMDYQEGATQRERNMQIGGHKSGT